MPGCRLSGPFSPQLPIEPLYIFPLNIVLVPSISDLHPPDVNLFPDPLLHFVTMVKTMYFIDTEQACGLLHIPQVVLVAPGNSSNFFPFASPYTASSVTIDQ